MVLFVEDSLIIAMDVEAALTELGAKTVLTASTIRQAREAVAVDAILFGILDVNQGAETSLRIADISLARSIPFVFASGYCDQTQLTEEYGSIGVITKLYGRNEIFSMWRATVV